MNRTKVETEVSARTKQTQLSECEIYDRSNSLIQIRLTSSDSNLWNANRTIGLMSIIGACIIEPFV